MMEITAFTTSGCLYCDKLKELFSRANVEYQLISVGQDLTREEFLHKYPDVTGYPYVIIDGEPVGGLVETAKLFLEKGLVSSKKNV
jgi:glutaredoxin 3